MWPGPSTCSIHGGLCLRCLHHLAKEHQPSVRRESQDGRVLLLRVAYAECEWAVRDLHAVLVGVAERGLPEVADRERLLRIHALCSSWGVGGSVRNVMA